ncbi:hypothetical protein LMG27177_03240 [Paraburkholderia fynbosensis]|uniref:Uncharacterized protein n=1 Tax=Paraburkholderia fynbosensis TaxID=1200993 RepID=A0A6J5G9I5_9BURK|nr:hypothetical protein LMG27177_03240 [Paraburkholderia fynbosensis]
MRLGTRVGAALLAAGAYDDVIIAAGIMPRKPTIAGIDGPNVLSYLKCCAGQESLRDLLPPTGAAAGSPRYHVIGGVKVASELDAKRAIREGAEGAAAL